METLINGATTLVAAFVGAWAAFELERRRRLSEQIDKQAAAINRALFTLANFWNGLRQHHLNVIEPALMRDGVWLNMGVDIVVTEGVGRLDVDDLLFLLQTHPQLFASLMLEQQRVDKIRGYLEARNRLIHDVVWPKLSAAGIQHGQMAAVADVTAIVGPGDARQAETLTTAIIDIVREDLVSLKEAFDTLRAVAKELYPKRKFVVYSFEPPLPAKVIARPPMA